MAREFTAPIGDEGFRIICPKCMTVWSTFRLPVECGCGAVVTVRAIPLRTKRVDKEIMAEHATLDRMIEVTKSARDWLA